MISALAYSDGGNRGNPGHHACAAAVWLFDGSEESEPVTEAVYLGPSGTNNDAEWQGLLLAMKIAKERGVLSLRCRLDSKLVVEQVLGNWRIRQPSLQPYFDAAQALAREFAVIEIKHVPREANRIADALCTQMLDEITGRRRR